MPFSSHKSNFFISKRFYYYNNLNKRNIIFRFFYNNLLLKSHMYSIYGNSMLIFSVSYTSLYNSLSVYGLLLTFYLMIMSYTHTVSYFYFFFKRQSITLSSFVERLRIWLAFFHKILYLRLLFSKFIQFLYYDRMFYLLKNVIFFK